MPLPIDNLTSVHLDAATDDPSQARAELLAAINKIKELIAALSVTPGVDKVPAHDANGNIRLGRVVGIGNAPNTDHDTMLIGAAVELGDHGLIYFHYSSEVNFARNAKIVSGQWVYRNNDQAQLIKFDTNGDYVFFTASQGAAGATINWIQKLLIPNAISASSIFDGGATFTGDLKVYRSATPSIGAIFLDSGGTRYLTYDGSNYVLASANLWVNGAPVWTSGNDGVNSGLDTDFVQGRASATAATPNTVVVRGAAGQTSIRGSRFHGDGGADSYYAAYETYFTQGNPAAQVWGADATGSVLTATFDAISGPYWSPPGRAALVIGRNTGTGRSIAALGTLVASGADYAEYEIKSDECGTVAKGQIVGFDASGKITDKWANALSFGIKTTAPSYVGGDTWGTPDVIGCEYPMLPVEPCEPQCLPTPKSLRHARHRHDEAVRHADMAKSALAAIQKDADKEVFDQAKKNLAVAELALAEAAATLCDEEVRAKNEQDKIDSDHHTACEKYAVDRETYKSDKAIYDERLEAARSTVDRVAYSGKVPCNVEGATPGDYIVPFMADDGGISGKAVSERDITFTQYRYVVGRVRKILDDGRPEVAVIVH